MTKRTVALFLCACLLAAIGCRHADSTKLTTDSEPSATHSEAPATPSPSYRETVESLSLCQTDDCMIDRIVDILLACPAWSQVAADDTASREEILYAMEELSKVNLDVLRAAVVKYVLQMEEQKRYYSSTDMSRIFVLNRYIFAVPEQVPWDSFPGFGSIAIPGDSSDDLDILWPLSVGADGELELTGTFTIYMGPEYLSVEEFDYFREQYGARE